ncbi:SctD/MshK family protein [Brevundimonas diminuta]|uniref:SctD/MshK family protein n=1 Tax=Brevundimonas diminuta TaxID=293 RepID=UPI003F7EE27F
MPADAVAAPEIESLVLRVLAGRVRGASAPLERGRVIAVGHDLDADIVLRDASAEGVRLTLKARADAADLDLTSGSVTLLGHELTAPAQAILPLYLPLLIGDNAVAIGEAESPRWSEAERILAAARPLPDDDGDEDAAPADDGRNWQYLLNNTNALVSRSAKFVPVLLIAVITVSALFAISTGVPAWPKSQPKPAKVQAVLSEEGFDKLIVTKTEAGDLRIEGMLASDAERVRLQRILAAREWRPRLELQTHDGIARQVEELYLANGVKAAARSVGAGMVRLDVTGSDPDEAARLERLAMGEIKGLSRIDVSMLPGADEGGRFEDIQQGGGKRVVSVIGGERGHVTTADGARYFPGAVLPTGHRIVSIEDTRVLVERNGSRSELNF